MSSNVRATVVHGMTPTSVMSRGCNVALVCASMPCRRRPVRLGEPMAEREHARVHAVQATGRDAVADTGCAEPQVDEVIERDDAVLRQRPLDDPPLQ